MGEDPFGRAIRDYHSGDQQAPLIQRDGERTLEHPIEKFYFTEISGDSKKTAWIEAHLDGPLLDVGAGAGKHALYFQETYETVALEVSEQLVEVMANRGVEKPRHGDMFSLPEQFDRDRFGSVLVHGTQIGLAGSMAGLRTVLFDLAYVTGQEATAVIDCYDPESEMASELLGYRADRTPGLAHRVMTFEYDGTVGETLLFRLFSPDRLREATVGTAWELTDIRYGSEQKHYLVALEKKRS